MSKIKVNTSKPVVPMIYAYTTPGITYHDGWTKIGYTERDVDARIREQTQTANVVAHKEWQDVAIFTDGKTRFTDREFHAYLAKNDIKRKEPQPDDEGCPEWFLISGDESYALFGKFRRDQGILETLGAVPYTLRDEQQKFVTNTADYLRQNDCPEVLWNAKPRFGKTLSVYDLCKNIGAQKVLVVTNRPSIANSWYDDYVKFLGTESGYYFVSNVDALRGRKFVLSREQYMQQMRQTNVKGCIEFVSLQDLKGSIYFGGSFDKLEEVAKLEWDILIVDETHEGVDTYKTDVAFDHIKRKYTLHLSGTPFKALANEKFPENAVFNWTYVDEQNAKRNWDDSREEENPYANLPQLNLFTYKMSDIVLEKATAGADFDDDGENEAYCWDLNEFFKTNASGNFVHDESVDKFLDALATQEKFPFSTDELRDELNHTLWLLKYISSAKALARKLEKHPVFGQYYVVLAAGDGRLDDEGESVNEVDKDSNIKKSFDKVCAAIRKHPKTITLSVGQLTTGITIPEWTAVLMLSNVKSPALYVQAAFRAQNPCLFDKDGVQMRKENCYVFDFDPARTLDIVEQFANDLHTDTANGRGDTDTRKKHVKDLLNFFPVYGEDAEGEMVELDSEKVLSIPRAMHAKEVVRRGFMSNFLFENIGNIFNAPQEVREILQKFDPVKEPIGITENTKKDLSIDDNGGVKIPEQTVIGLAQDVFGEKLYGEVESKLSETIEELNEPQEPQKEWEYGKVLQHILDDFRENMTNRLLETATDSDGNKLSASTKKNLSRQLDKSTEVAMQKHFGDFKIQSTLLENERKQQLENAFGDSEKTEEINREFDQKAATVQSEFAEKVKSQVHKIVAEAGKTIVATAETEKNDRERKDLMDNVRDRLRGFARTIPSFLMAYGIEETTLQNFDKDIPAEVFLEVTGITLDEFRRLRDGFDYTDENGETKHYNGFFNTVVFDDSVKEFLRLKKKLGNYFADDVTEDIFDYIPPQKTNQIFTPKNVVKLMVGKLEEENPGCFDDPDKTFVDLYMKSGLYIAEIVKRLFRSAKMKRLFPDDGDRLRHIFEKQVYGCAPTEIIYRIVLSFVLGFDGGLKIEKHNLKLFDTLPDAQNGTLEKKLDEVFG